MNHTIVHFEIPVDSPDRAIAFYQALFGWKIREASPSPEMQYWLVETVPVNAEGMPAEPGVNGGMMKRMVPEQGPVNYMHVESVEDYMKKVEGLGGKILVPKMPVPGMGWFAHCIDTEGNPFALWEVDSQAK